MSTENTAPAPTWRHHVEHALHCLTKGASQGAIAALRAALEQPAAAQAAAPQQEPGLSAAVKFVLDSLIDRSADQLSVLLPQLREDVACRRKFVPVPTDALVTLFEAYACTAAAPAAPEAAVPDAPAGESLGQPPRYILAGASGSIRTSDALSERAVPDAPAAQTLTEDDVFTLIGHAIGLHGDGKRDMPAYFMQLAERVAMARGDKTAAQRVRDLMQQHGIGAAAKGQPIPRE